MSAVRPIDPEDLPLYAMSLLAPDEMERMTAQLADDGKAQEKLREIYGDLALYAHTVEMEELPAGAQQRFAERVAREKKPIPIDRAKDGTGEVREAARPRSAGMRVLPWLGWAAAAVLAMEAGHLYRYEQQFSRQKQQLESTLAGRQQEMDRALSEQREEMARTVAEERRQLTREAVSAQLANTVLETFRDPEAQNAVLTSTGVKPPPQGRAAYDPKKGSLVFLASNLARLNGAKTYELWLIPTTGKPIPAGTFRPDAEGYASVILPRLPRGVTAKEFGVTVENQGGSDAPTSPIILAGRPGQPA